MAVRVGRWDCDVCGHIGNYGPHTKCASCGASRPANVKFYLPKDAEIVTDKEQLKEARAGVDWICGHCYSQNKAKDTVCNSCGNPRDESS
ncbi:MAG: zinc finger Ran-binding domain-containing family 2 protein, partial [Bacteroidetes bacterium]|nr:zinc finger Ran-binding domain-containing family 2 protein [Bacteroidota bacterium]